MTTRMSVRLEETLRLRLEERAQALGIKASEALRQAVEHYVADAPPKEQLTPGERLRRSGMIGVLKGGPTDLATNEKHMEGFGE